MSEDFFDEDLVDVEPQVALPTGMRQQYTGESTYERFTDPRWAAVVA